MVRMESVCDSECCTEYNAYAIACKSEHEVPWGTNHRRVMTINDGIIGAEKSTSVTCMHYSDTPCMMICPVGCFYRIEDGVALHDRGIYTGYGYCSYACPFGASQLLSQGMFGVRSEIDKYTFYTGGPEKNGGKEEFEKYGRNRLVERKLPLCAEMCSTKAPLGSDNDMTSDILRNQVMEREKGAELFGWGTAYGGAQGKDGQAAPTTSAAPVKPTSASGAQS